MGPPSPRPPAPASGASRSPDARPPAGGAARGGRAGRRLTPPLQKPHAAQHADHQLECAARRAEREQAPVAAIREAKCRRAPVVVHRAKGHPVAAIPLAAKGKGDALRITHGRAGVATAAGAWAGCSGVRSSRAPGLTRCFLEREDVFRAIVDRLADAEVCGTATHRAPALQGSDGLVPVLRELVLAHARK